MVNINELTIKKSEILYHLVNKLLLPEIKSQLFDDRYGYTEIFNLLANPSTIIYLLQEENAVIGIIFFTNLIPGRDAIVNACIFEKEYRGKGKILEIYKQITRSVKEKYFLESCETYVREDNIVSQKLLEKIGFKEVGIRRKKNLMEGEMRNLKIYDIIREEIKDG